MDLRTLGVPLIAALAGCGVRDSESAGIPASVAYEAHLRAGGANPPADTLTNPFGRDESSVKEGGQLFSAMNCDGCHGGGGLGWVGPSLVDGRWRYGGGDGALYHSIFYGRPRGMPAYGGMLSAEAIWKMVAYLRAQPIPATVPTQSWEAPEAPRPTPEREEAGVGG